MRLAAAALAVFALAGTGHAGRPCPGSARLGAVAYVRDGVLHVLDLGTCRDRVLVAKGVEPPVRFSADGRWIAFGRVGAVVSASGGPVLHLLGATASEEWLPWTWSPGGDVLAAATKRGGVLLGGPGRAPRRLLPDGFDARTLAFDPSGKRLAVSRPLSPFARLRKHQELWIVDVATGARRLLFRLTAGELAPPELAGWSPDGRFVLFWLDSQNSASLSADGLPLRAVPAAGGEPAELPDTLVYFDYLTWCGVQLIVAAGGGRVAGSGKSLVAASPPSFARRDLSRDRSSSWISPACSPDGTWVAAAAGPDTGLELNVVGARRSLWLLAADGSSRRRLTRPPAGFSDESPQWSRDGRAVLFVRTEARQPFRGLLYLVRPGGSALGPIVRLGASEPYYGDFGWTNRLDWYRPRVR